MLSDIANRSNAGSRNSDGATAYFVCFVTSWHGMNVAGSGPADLKHPSARQLRTEGVDFRAVAEGTNARPTREMSRDEHDDEYESGGDGDGAQVDHLFRVPAGVKASYLPECVLPEVMRKRRLGEERGMRARVYI